MVFDAQYIFAIIRSTLKNKTDSGVSYQVLPATDAKRALDLCFIREMTMKDKGDKEKEEVREPSRGTDTCEERRKADRLGRNAAAQL